MASDTDDALQWEGDEESPRNAPKKAARPTLPEGWEAVGKGSEEVVVTGSADDEAAVGVAEADAAPSGSGQMSTPMLLIVGILAGVYLLYTVGWVIGALRLQVFAETFLLSNVLAYRVSMVLAIAAPALWFLTAWVLTRRSKSWVRVSALVAGALVLVPWPFVMVGSLGGGL